MTAPAAPRRLRTEGLPEPLGLDEVQPRLAWLPGPGDVPLDAAEVECASSLAALLAGTADLWRGAVDGPSLVQTRYAGAPLASRARVWWRVRLATAARVWSAWSEPATFEMGLLTQEMWAPAVAVRTPLSGTFGEPGRVPMLRREFDVEELGEARVYVTAWGSYDVRLNGARVTEEVLRPGWTEYHRRLPYQVYDVSALLRPGANVLSVLLGDGWFCGFVGGGRQQYGDRPAFLLRLELARGGQDPELLVGTDAGWRWAPSALHASDHYRGEHCDLRDEPVGWREAGFDDGAWQPVEVHRAHPPLLVAPRSPGVRRVEVLTPSTVATDGSTRWLLDVGANVAGRLRLDVEGDPGTVLRVRHAEALDAEGALWRGSLGAATAEDTLVLADGRAEHEPTFTSHGFRYAELEVVTGRLAGPLRATAHVLTTPLDETGWFESSSPLLDQFVRNVWATQRSNQLEIPTDCPQRDERLGWTGDVHPFIPSACFRWDVRPLMEKWLRDLADCQLDDGAERGAYSSIAPYRWMPGGPGWSDAALLVPVTLWRRYGDATALEEHYDRLVRWMGFLERRAAGRVPGTWEGYGDWLSLDADGRRDWGWDDRFGGTPPALLADLFHLRACDLMAVAACVVDRPADEPRWHDRARSLRADVVRRWVSSGRLEPFTQTAAALALDLSALPADVAAATAADLAADVRERGHLTTGFVGTPHLLPALRDHGYLDEAYALLERQDCPSWLYPVAQGATSVWERWDAHTPDGDYRVGMNSLNHVALGSVLDWVVQTVGGLRPEAGGPGYETFVVRPQPGGSLTHATTRFLSVHGEIRCAWRLVDGRMALEVTVPPAATAVVHVGASPGDVVRVGPGTHAWTVPV